MDKSSLNRILIFSHLFLLIILGLLLSLSVETYIVVAVMALMIALVLAFISRNLRKQYQLISTIAERISQGDHSLRIPDLELEEFNLLGKDLNVMLANLDQTIHHLAIHREELRMVLSSINDPLWSQRQDGRIVWANRAFEELLPLYDPKSKQTLQDIEPGPELLDLVQNWNIQNNGRICELSAAGHVYLLSGNRNESANRTVYLLQNIDSLRQTEQIKKDFIVNLAHELRTPLTAIKGFADAMQEHISDGNKRYLRIIQNHTGRLIHLVKDLEQLIQLESTINLDKQEINLYTFFDNLHLILSPMVEDKELALNIGLADNLPRFACDPFRLEQVFINLVQNSLRYTESGSISIKCESDKDSVSFKVIDTGKGINPVHLPRIFERFYVADPARNRNHSGTGLGLAIVKHIVNIHDGQITVSSEQGQGTTFSLSFPI